MTFQQILPEIEKGRGFKRKHWQSYSSKTINCKPLTLSEILSDDWELEIQPITISLEDLKRAWKSSDSDSFKKSFPVGDYTFNKFAIDLGF